MSKKSSITISLDNESYISKEQLENFKQRLLTLKKELEHKLHTTKKHLREEEKCIGDLYDHVSREMHITRELNNKDRYSNLINKVNQALKCIEQGTYGYCIETGTKIGIKRLEAEPFATLSIEVQERKERYKRNHSL